MQEVGLSVWSKFPKRLGNASMYDVGSSHPWEQVAMKVNDAVA
jgi:hypothetical protein